MTGIGVVSPPTRAPPVAQLLPSPQAHMVLRLEMASLGFVCGPSHSDGTFRHLRALCRNVPPWVRFAKTPLHGTSRHIAAPSGTFVPARPRPTAHRTAHCGTFARPWLRFAGIAKCGRTRGVPGVRVHLERRHAADWRRKGRFGCERVHSGANRYIREEVWRDVRHVGMCRDVPCWVRFSRSCVEVNQRQLVSTGVNLCQPRGGRMSGPLSRERVRVRGTRAAASESAGSCVSVSRSVTIDPSALLAKERSPLAPAPLPSPAREEGAMRSTSSRTSSARRAERAPSIFSVALRVRHAKRAARARRQPSACRKRGSYFRKPEFSLAGALRFHRDKRAARDLYGSQLNPARGVASELPLPGTPGRRLGERGERCAAMSGARDLHAHNPSPLPSPRRTGEREIDVNIT
jgi:hypothetical protein